MSNKVIIIGAGPGGLSCATYLQRLGVGSTVLYQTFGGKQNYYKDIYGLYPADRTDAETFLREQRISFERVMASNGNMPDVTEVNSSVKSLLRGKDGVFHVETEKGVTYKSDVVVLATGTRIAVPAGISARLSKFLTFKDYPYRALKPADRVLLLGAGYTAAEAVSIIASKVATIQVVDVSDKNFSLLGPPRKRCFEDLQNVEVTFDPDYVLTERKVRFKKDGKTIDYFFDHVVLCTGEKPNVELLPEYLLDRETGRVEMVACPSDYEVNMAAEWEGLYVIGDLKNDRLTSYITYAAADGMQTAQSIQRYFQIKNGVLKS